MLTFTEKQIRDRAKKLFARIHNVKGYVSIAKIQAVYPRFTTKIKDCWQLLIFKLLGRNAKGDKVTSVQTAIRKISATSEKLKSADLNLYNDPTIFCGELLFTFRGTGKKSYIRGNFKYNILMDTWSYCIGKMSYSMPTSNLNIVINAAIVKSAKV